WNNLSIEAFRGSHSGAQLPGLEAPGWLKRNQPWEREVDLRWRFRWSANAGRSLKQYGSTATVRATVRPRHAQASMFTGIRTAGRLKQGYIGGGWLRRLQLRLWRAGRSLSLSLTPWPSVRSSGVGETGLRSQPKLGCAPNH